MSRRHALMLLVLAAIWGSSFMFIKVAVRQLDPSTLVFGRLVLALVAFAVLLPFLMPLPELVASFRANICEL